MDSKGRKFANCTAVRPSYELKGEKIITLTKGFDNSPNLNKYQMIKDYIAEDGNEDLLIVRQRFDEQDEVTFSDELNILNTPTLSRALMRHNNFGVCSQQQVQGESEGLARLKASYIVHEYTNGPGRLI